MTKGPIIIIDDDEDDQAIYTEAIRSIKVPNQLILFDNAQKALDYLSATDDQPFIILCDINMPGINGLELKSIIQDDHNLRKKGVPFVFISTNASAMSVKKAHLLSVQGYFEKPSNMEDVKLMLKKLFDYWELCKHVNNT